MDGEDLEGKLSLVCLALSELTKVRAVLVSGCASGAVVDATAVHHCFLGGS